MSDKHILTIIIAICFILVGVDGQQDPQWKGKIEHKNGLKTIKNPQEPLSGNARRIVHLKEMARIKDNGKDIVFRSPDNLVVDNNGNIYFLSYPHLYKYDKDGNFILKLKKIDEVITRKFERIKRPKIKKKPGFRYGPDREFYQDIQKLLIFGDNLWAITSEKNAKNEWLIDVFDKDGKYMDSFFLSFPADIEPKRYQNIQLIAWKNFLYSVDQDEEGYYSIAKYIIGD